MNNREDVPTFTMPIPSGALRLYATSLTAGRWRLELLDAHGNPRHHEDISFADVVTLHEGLRAAVGLELYDPDPNLAEVAARMEARAGRATLHEVRLAWIYRALAVASERRSARDDALFAELGECCARFLDQEPDAWGLSHPSRKVSGKRNSAHWARLNRPIQDAMGALAAVVVPTLREATDLRAQGSVALTSLLRERCVGELARFSNDVVFHVGAQLGTERCEASLVLARRAPDATLNEVQRAVLEERLSGHIVGAFVDARDPHSPDLQGIVGLDPADQDCVRTVMRFALGVFLSARDVDSWIRTFRLIDDEGVL